MRYMRYSNVTLGQLYFLLACIFTTVNTFAIVSPSQFLSSSAFANPPFVNSTALDLTVNPEFNVKAIYGETSIPLTPCFMNVVELLAQYAELDWLSRVRQRHGVVLPSYPQVEIAVLAAAPATSIEVRLVVWGLWAGVNDIIANKQFFEVEFEVYWQRELVASIFFTKPMDLQITSSNGAFDTDPSPNETTDGTVDTLNNTEISPATLNEGNFEWKPFFSPTAQSLTVVEVFLTVMAGLKNAAPHKASEKIPRPYASSAVDVFANVQFFLHKRRSPRPKPPYFQYIHVIKTLRLVPGYLLEKKRFAELFFMIEVNGVTVGEGYLEKGHYVPPRFGSGGLLEPKDNVSLS